MKMITQRLLGQATHRHYRRSYLLSILATGGRGFDAVLRAVLGKGNVQNLQSSWASIGVLGQFATILFMDGNGKPAANGADEPISEHKQCWSHWFERPQERFRT